MGEDEAEWGLVCPFLDENPRYAAGVEVGMLFRDMRRKRRIQGHYQRANQEQILLMANRLKWKVVALERDEDKGEPWEKDWFWIEMKRATK